MAVDTASGLISHLQADFADRRDSMHLPEQIPQLQARLTTNELTLRDIVADMGYSNGFNYAFLEQWGITPWIPVFGHYKPAPEGFTYEAAGDAVRCSAGKLLPFRTYATSKDGNWAKNYRAAYQDCQQCPARWHVRRPRPNRSLYVRLLTRPIGARGTGNKVGRGSRRAGSGNAPSSLFLVACCITMVRDESAPRAGRQLIKSCCSARLRTTLRSCSSISQNRPLGQRWRSTQHK